MDSMTLTYGDGISLDTDEDGGLAVRIQNRAFVEEPRWLRCDVIGGDRRQYLNELIEALEQLRDQPKAATDDDHESASDANRAGYRRRLPQHVSGRSPFPAR